MRSDRSKLIFLLVFGWKAGLFLVAALPVPANDAFFYDGAVVNRLLNGGYFNPSLAAALPISGAEVFSAYPPLYQLLLLGWMAVFGASAWSAMALHIVLFGVYLVVLRAIFRRLGTPDWCVGVAGAFLLLLTFHDRPDSLAQVLGMMAVYSWVRFRGATNELRALPDQRAKWAWAMALFVVLCLATSLQIGGIYFLLIWVGMLAACWWSKERFPMGPMALTILIPTGLVLMVKMGFPHLWQGFLEHARQTPSLTGLRRLNLDEVLKVARTAPGVIFVAAALPLVWRRQRVDLLGSLRGNVLLATLAAALAVVGACLLILTANMVGIANYLQPLIVGSYLALASAGAPIQQAITPMSARWLRAQIACLLVGAALGSVRMVGMSTWGLACAKDVSYSTAVRRVGSELEKQPRGSVVVLSSAFLYEAARHKNVRWLHSDWLVPIRRGETSRDADGLFALKPAQIILTQFDYYRRYQRVLEEVRTDPRVKEIQIENTAKIRPPDAYSSIQKVVQHISWAPVVVNISWR